MIVLMFQFILILMDENAHFNGYADLNFLNIFPVDPLFGVSYNIYYEISFLFTKKSNLPWILYLQYLTIT